MFSLKFANALGNVIDLTSSENLKLTNVTGLNPPNADIITSTSPNFDGEMFNSSKVQKRNVVIYLVIERNVESERLNLYKFFRVKQKGTLYYKSEYRDVWIEGYVDTFEINNFSNPVTVQISLTCPQPYFNSIDEMVTEIADVISLLEFPVSLPEAGIEFGKLDPYREVVVENNGEIETGVIFEFRAIGAVVNPTIFNADTQEFFGLNLTMQTGDVIKISTYTGSKTATLIRQGSVSNVFNYITANSTWLTLQAGENSFKYTTKENSDGTNTNANLYIKIYHTDQYEGV